MGKLNQIIAIEKGVKSRVYSEVGEMHKALQKPGLFNGFSKEYRPKDEDGETLPPERQRVQFVAIDVLRSIERSTAELFDVTAKKDWTNRNAVADISVDGTVILSQVPVTFLLFLEKQLTDFRTIVASLPTLDEGESWKKDENSGFYRTDPVQTHRTKKTPKVIVKYDATPEHPAQTELYMEDLIAGYWHTTKLSGAMPKPQKTALAERVEKLLHAVKEAREAANGIDAVAAPDVGQAIFGYLLQN